MAKAGASKKDDKNFYILYCCTNCDEKFGSEDALEDHIKTYKHDNDTAWIKQEPGEEYTETAAPSQEFRESVSSLPVLAPSVSQSQTVTLLRAVKTESEQPEPVPVSISGPLSLQQCVPPPAFTKQAMPPSPVLMLANQMAAPQLIGQPSVTMAQPPLAPAVFHVPSSQFIAQPQVLLPQYMSSAPMVSPQLVVQPQLSCQQVPSAEPSGPKPQYYNAASSLTASEILRQRFQKTQSQAPAKSSAQSPRLSSKGLPRGKKMSPAPGPSSVRAIRPKETKMCSIKVQSKSSSDPSIPKIERVYYTSKADSAPVTVTQTSVVSNVQGIKEQQFSGQTSNPQASKQQDSDTTETAVVAKLQAGTGKGVAVVHPQAQQNIVQVSQSQQPIQQTRQVLIQTSQGVFQIAQPFLQNPQNSLQYMQTVLQNPSSLLQNNRMLLQQNLLQHNLFQAQAGQQNSQTSQLLSAQGMPPVKPQQITVQASQSAGSTVLTTQPTPRMVYIQSGPASATATTTTSSQKHQSETGIASAVSENKPAVSSSYPVTSLAQLVHRIPQAGAVGQMQPLRVAPPAHGPGYMLMSGGIKSPESTSSQVSSADTQGKDSLPAATTSGAASLTASQVQGLIKQNPSSVVLLPPVLAQGHILSGIHLTPPNLKSAIVLSAKPGESTTQHQQQQVVSKPELSSEPRFQDFQIVGRKGKRQKAGDDSPKRVLDSSLVKAFISSSPDKIAMDVARLLLFGDRTKVIKEEGPVVIEDGRIFVPVAYTGPYTLRQRPSKKRITYQKPWPWLHRKKTSPMSESVEKADDIKSVEEVSGDVKSMEELSDYSKEEEIQPAPSRTIHLSGDVWIFLDKDGPKVLWKTETEKPQVLFLPLDYKLPVEAVLQIAEMLKRTNIEFPPGLLSSPPPSPPPHMPSVAFRYNRKERCQEDRLLVQKAVQIMSGRNVHILPKRDVPVTTSSTTAATQPAPTPSLSLSASLSLPTPSQALPTSSLPLAMPSLPNPAPSLVFSTPSLPLCAPSLPRPLLQSQPLGHQVPFNLTAAPVPRLPMPTLIAAMSCPPVAPVGPAVALGPTSVSLEQEKKGSGTPVSEGKPSVVASPASKLQETRKDQRYTLQQSQLTVNADANTVKRALEVFVRLERLTLTEKLQQQIQYFVHAPKAVTRRTDLANLQGELADSVTGQKKSSRKPNWLKDLIQTNKPEHSSEQEAENTCSTSNHTHKVGEPSWRGKNEVEDTGPENINTEERGKRRKRLSKDKESDEHFEGRKTKKRKTRPDLRLEDPGQTSVRRSVRFFYKPKRDYSTLDSHRDSEDDMEIQIGHGVSNMKDSPSVSRSLGKHGGCDVYIESADSIEEEQTEEEDIPNEVDNVKEDLEDSTLSCEEFLLRHEKDFQQVVMKELRANETTAQGISDHILYFCIICGSFQSRSGEELVSHLKLHYLGKLDCKECNFSAGSEQELLEHDALEHTGKPLYHCKTCQTSFFNQAIFQNHLKRHTSSNVTCKVCQAQLPNDGALSKHMETQHTQEYLCQMCDQRFVSEDKLRHHYRECEEGYQCCLCPVKMILYTDLRQHMESKHNHTDQLLVCTGKRCDETFLTAEQLQQHKAVRPNCILTGQHLQTPQWDSLVAYLGRHGKNLGETE
ncbi:uncharacterized protein [Littorina saxatilis]|uniref:C2H2-type domain-containing protein n=1 Tax=Littorina saxatilis TaxID=31220 RepID=A0AAN9BWE4_9CAEN